MRKVWLSVLVVGAIVGALGAAWFAQAARGVKVLNNDTYPLQVLSVSPQLTDDGAEFRGAKVTLQNTGNVPCVAFAVSLVLIFSNSETRKVELQEDHVALGYASAYVATDPIGANQIYTAETTEMQVAAHESATVTGVEARVDYVEMADGKTYGEDPDKVGGTFRMTRWGHAAERKRLLSIYDAGGLQALLDELRRE